MPRSAPLDAHHYTVSTIRPDASCAPVQCPTTGRFASLLDAQLAEQRRRNAEDVATLVRLIESGTLTRAVVEAPGREVRS